MGGGVVDNPGGMLEDVVAMKHRFLVESFEGHEFGEDGSQHIDAAKQRIMDMRAGYEQVDLVGHALAGQRKGFGLCGAHGVERGGLEVESQLGSEPTSAQDAQGVFCLVVFAGGLRLF